MKGAKHDLKRVYPSGGLTTVDGTDYAHTIIRVVMKNGESYALDMAGAQYGWHEPTTPWQLYNASRVRRIKEVVPFGGTTIFCKTRVKTLSEQQKWVHTINENFAYNVDEAVMWWQKRNISLVDLLHLPEQEFQRRRASLLDTVKELLQLSKTVQESKGAFTVSGGFKDEGFDRKFTSSALGFLPGRSLPSSKTA